MEWYERVSEMREGDICTREQLEEQYRYKPVPVDWFVQDMRLKLEEAPEAVNKGEILEHCYLDDEYENYTDIFSVTKEAFREEIWTYSRLEFLEHVCKTDVIIEKNEITVCTDLNDEQQLNLLQHECYKEHYELAAFFAMMQMKRVTGAEPPTSVWFKNATNYDYIREMIEDKKAEFILIEDYADPYVCRLIKQLLQSWGHVCFAVYCGGDIFLEEGEAAWDTVAVSLEEMEGTEGAYSIPYYNICHGESCDGTNLEFVLEALVKTKLKRELGIILAANDVFDYLEASHYGNHVQMMSDPGLHYFKNYLKFGWAGDYLEYISDVFDCDVKTDMEAEKAQDFSIIIPVKNSAETLKYTVETCITQDYEGSYEIIISDNSDMGRMEVFTYIRELNNPRIRYFKTPRNLPLTKSFEYAILKSRGKYIVPLGADDGLLPWCLSTLAEVWKQYPKEDIVQWERQFYAWPGFNGSQQNQLKITRKYAKGQWNAFYKTKEDYLALALLNDNYIYAMPLLYINSAFQRDYIKTVYEATGRLWDGASQDVYMGIISVGLHDRILNIKYPLSVAGMSGSSVGARQVQVSMQDNEEFQKLGVDATRGDNVAVYMPGALERVLPSLPNDVSNLYMALLRGIERGVFPYSYIDDLFDMHSIFKKMYSNIRLDDDLCEVYLHMGRYKAKQMDEEFGRWFEDNIYTLFLNNRRKLSVAADTKPISYDEGRNADGGITIDASKYGISNVFQAAEFIAAYVDSSGKRW